MSIGTEFREFIARGNVIDLAVGVIIGAAFGAITKSLVDQVIMPPIGLLLGGVDFSSLQYVLKPDDPTTADVVETVAIQYGAFINTVIQFLIVAFVVFMVVKAVNSLRRKEAADPAPTAPPAPTPSEALLVEIRDLLTVRAPAAPAAPAAAKAAPAVKTTAAKAPAAKASAPKSAAKPAAKRPTARKPKAS